MVEEARRFLHPLGDAEPEEVGLGAGAGAGVVVAPSRRSRTPEAPAAGDDDRWGAIDGRRVVAGFARYPRRIQPSQIDEGVSLHLLRRE